MLNTYEIFYVSHLNGRQQTLRLNVCLSPE